MLCSVAAVELMRHFKRIRSLLLQCVNIAHRARLVYGPNGPFGPCGPSGSSGPARPSGLIGPIGLAKKNRLPCFQILTKLLLLSNGIWAYIKLPFKNFLAVKQLMHLVKLSYSYHIGPTKFYRFPTLSLIEFIRQIN